MANYFEEALADYNAEFQEQIFQLTWGHLAPTRNKKYKGKILFAVSCFCSEERQLINYEFQDLDSSPWLYDAVHEFLEVLDEEGTIEAGCVYEFTGVIRNYKIEGTLKKIHELVV